jgi:hypothetical protein
MSYADFCKIAECAIADAWMKKFSKNRVWASAG